MQMVKCSITVPTRSTAKGGLHLQGGPPEGAPGHRRQPEQVGAERSGAGGATAHLRGR